MNESDWRELYEEFTIELSCSPIKDHEVRGITLETFKAMIDCERLKAYTYGLQDGFSQSINVINSRETGGEFK